MSTESLLKAVLAIKLILCNAKARYIISSMFWETQGFWLQTNTNTRLLHGRQIQAASTNLTRRKEQQQTTISLRNYQPWRRRQRAVCCWPSCRLVSHNSIFINQPDNFNYIRNWCSNKQISPAVYMFYVESWCLNVLVYSSRRSKSKYVEYFRACKEQWSGMRSRSVRQSARCSLLKVGPMIHS